MRIPWFRLLRTTCPRAGGLALLTALAALGASCAEDPVRPRHVVIVSIDTLRRDHVTAYGYPRDTTPALQRLADTGVTFENAYAANTNTAPSHASMLTGLHPARHGVVRNGGYWLRTDVRTLGEILGSTWARAAFVSGFPLRRNMTDLYRDFDHFDDHLGEDWRRDAAATFAASERWLRERKDDRPLFLFFHLYDAHQPYTAPEPFRSRFLPEGQRSFRFSQEQSIKRFYAGEADAAEFDEYERRYDAAIAYADHHVGRLFALLEELGLWDEALVVVLADHGETLDERSGPYFDHGARVYDPEIRIPLLLRLPGSRGSRRVAAMVHHVDLAPTILDLLGLDAPRVDGDSLRPLVVGAPWAHDGRPAFSSADAESWQMPELGGELDYNGLVVSLRTPDWKLISYPGVKGEILQLFHVARDPAEGKDLASTEPQRREQLRRELHAWEEATGFGGTGPRPSLSPSEEEGLRALGYLR